MSCVRWPLRRRLAEASLRCLRLFSIRSESALRTDYYNDPQQRAWNPRDPTLYFDFRVLHDTRDVERIVRSLGAEISVEHLCSAVARLRQLRCDVDPLFLRHLADQVLTLLSSFEGRHIAATLYAMARLGFEDPKFYTALALEAMQGNYLQAYSPIHLSNLVYGVGMLQKTSEQRRGIQLKPRRNGDASVFDQQQRLLELLVKETLLTVDPGRLNRVQTVSVVYGLGLAKFERPDWLGPLLSSATSQERFRRYSGGEMTNLLYGMVLMNMQKDNEFISVLTDALTKASTLRRLGERELTCLIYCLRLLQYDNIPQLMQVRDELIDPSRLKYLSEQAISMMLTNLRCLNMKEASSMGPLIQELASPRLLKQIPAQGLAMAIYNYAVSEFREPSVLERLVSVAMEPEHVRQFSTTDISNLLFALSTVQYNRIKALEPLKVRLRQPELLENLNPGHVANMFYGSARLGWMGVLSGELTDFVDASKIHRLSTSNLVTVLYGLSQSTDPEHRHLSPILDQILKSERHKEFSANQLASVISSLGKAKYRDGAAVEVLMQEMIQAKRLEQCSASALAMTLHGLAGLEFREASPLGSFLREVILPSRLAEFLPSQLSIIVYSLGKIGVEDARVMTPILNELMKESRLTNLSCQGLTNTLYGLSLLTPFDERIWTELSCEVRKTERLQSLRALELSLLLYAYGMKRWKHPVLQDILAMAQKDAYVKDLTTVGLASSLYSLSQLEMHGHPCVEIMATEFSQERHLTNSTAHHLANVVFALGLLDHRDDKVMERICEEAKGRVEAFSRHGLYNLIFGFGRLQYKNAELLDELWKEVLKLERLAGFTDREWATIAYSLDQLKFKEEDSVVRLRTKILSTRGLPVNQVPRTDSRRELTSDDIQNLRREVQNAVKGDDPVVWLDEKNVLRTRSDHEKYQQMRIAGWRDRSQPATYPRTQHGVYGDQGESVGPDLLPEPRQREIRKKNKPARKRVMIFNQTEHQISDDEMPSGRQFLSQRRERIISPWQSPYYNLRVVEWPESPGPAKTLNQDFEPPAKDEEDSPHADGMDTTDEEEFDFDEDTEASLELPAESARQTQTQFKYLMQEEARRAQEKDAQAMDTLVEGLTDFAEQSRRHDDDH